MRQFLSTDFIVIDGGDGAGWLPAHLLRCEPAQARAAVALALCTIAALAVIDWQLTSIQLAILALIPLAVFTWFAQRQIAYGLAFLMGLGFTYFDYAGPTALAVNLPLDTAFTVVSYLAVVALVLAARGSIASALNLREQLAITAETVSIQRWLADHDPLTSAANRRAFRKKLMEAAAHANIDGMRFGLILGDVDNFKAVNTQYGHRTGDRLLCTLFSRAQAACPPDTLVGRIDGDEFALLLPAKTDWELLSAANKIAKALREPYDVDEQSVKLSMTLVTAMFPADAGDADGLLELAEERLYEAKGRTR